MSLPTGERGYLIEEYIPTNHLSIVYGSHGVGKTTFVLQMLEDFLQGHEVWGRATHPVPVCYVACNRATEALEATMHRIGLSPSSIPHLSLIGRGTRLQHNLDVAIELAQKLVSPLRFLILDDFSSLCQGKINDFKDVAQFVRDTQNLCDTKHLTILGTVTGVKAKQGAGYENLSDRMHGSTAFNLAETKICIEHMNPRDKKDANREVTFLPQNHPPTISNYTFEDGRLVEKGDAFFEKQLDQWLVGQKPGTVLVTKDFRDIGATVGLSSRTVFRWLRTVTLMTLLVKTAHGQYLVPEASSKPSI